MFGPGANRKRRSAGFILIDALVSLSIVVILALGLTAAIGGFVVALSRATAEVERAIAFESETDGMFVEVTSE